MTLLRPEDFGAVGNGTTDDTDALLAMIAAWQPTKLDNGCRIEFTAGAVYKVTAPLRISPRKHFRFVLVGNGASIDYHSDGVALQIGDYAADERCIWSAIRDLRIEVRDTCGVGMLLGGADHMRLDNVQIQGPATEALLKLEQANHLCADSVCVGGGDVGILCDGITNVITFRSGFAEGCRVGIVQRGSIHVYEAMDLTRNREWGAIIHGGNVRMNNHMESMGTKAAFDQGGCYLIDGGTNVEIAGVINATNGGDNSGTNAGYGVRCINGARNVRVMGSGKLPQRHFVFADETCESIIIEPPTTCTINSSGKWGDGPHPCTPNIINNGALFLDPNEPGVLPEAKDWEAHKGAEWIAPGLLHLPQSTPTGSYLKVSQFQPAPNTAYRLEARCRVVAELDPERVHHDLNALLFRVGNGNDIEAEIKHRPGEQWGDFVLAWTSTSDPIPVNIFFMLATTYEPIDLEIAFVRLRAV
jgi:hypothetical protein